jgi:hypothetical protein
MLDDHMIAATTKPGAGAIAAATDPDVAATSPSNDEMSNRWR